jgi:hypothetical protein
MAKGETWTLTLYVRLEVNCFVVSLVTPMMFRFGVAQLRNLRHRQLKSHCEWQG